MNGVVKWFDSEKGYGFIETADDGSDLFVHYTDIAAGGFRNLEQGQRVMFDLRDTSKGPKAVNVRVRHGY